MLTIPLMLLIRFGLAFGVTVALVPLCRALAFRVGCVAKPKVDRWHSRPTPLLGGVAIALSVLLLSAAFGLATRIPVLLTAIALIFIVGFVDDILTIKPSTKLVAQIGVASLLLFFGYRLHWSSSLLLDSMITLVWIVGVTNAFNLLDNMDGLCTGIGLIGGAGMLAALTDGVMLPPEGAYLSLLLGALAGFLAYNFHPASIFMGDSGSLLIGLSLASVALGQSDQLKGGSRLLAAMAVPLLVLLIPIFDTALVTTMRLLAGRKPSQGGRDHSSHRLVAIGLSERNAVAVLWTLAAGGALIGVWMQRPSGGFSALAAVVFILAMAVFAVYLARVRVYEDADPTLLRSGLITPFVTDFMYKRRVAEVLLDLCLVPLAYYGAYGLRFEGTQWASNFPRLFESLPIVVAVQITALFVIGAYRGVWRYFGLMDGVVFAKAVSLGTTVIVILLLFLYRFENYSRGVFVIYAALLMILLMCSRASFRLIQEFVQRRQPGERLVIYGAGDAGALAVRELLNDKEMRYRMLGFADDDPGKIKTRVQGYPVLGHYETLAALVTAGAVDTVAISMRSLGLARVRALEELCAAHGVTLLRFQFTVERLVSAS
jgi:UDP-GlcNAc:undecaprenyl-phosphate GlcNAc-1-phosphate transferase